MNSESNSDLDILNNETTYFDDYDVSLIFVTLSMFGSTITQSTDYYFSQSLSHTLIFHS